MCQTCFESYGSPSVVTDKITKAVELIENLYEQWGCCAGGYAHIVTDDWNLEDGNVEWCLNEAKEGASLKSISEEGRLASIETLEYLLKLTETERATALALVDGFLTVE